MAEKYTYIPNRVIDANGISDGASIYFYQEGTTTPISIYSNASLSTPLSNPVVVPAGSAVPVVYYSGDAPRVKVVTSAGVTVSDDDPYIKFASVADIAPVITAGTLPTPSTYGALTPVGTAAATLATAYTSVGVGGKLLANDDFSVGTAAVNNPGADFIGDKGIYYNTGVSGGNRLLNRPGRAAELHQWGRENLVRWLEGLRTNATLKVALVGDSNTEAYVGAALATYLDSLPNITLTNFGVSGTQIEQWRTAASPYNSNSKALTDVVAFDPDLIVMCWGTNDPVVGARDADDFSTSLASALTTLRTSLGVNACSIALLTPQALGDTSGRDELWNLQIRPIIRTMAERFDCAYFDKNALFPNSVIDLAAGAMQNKWLDSNRVHTSDVATNIIAAMVAEWLVPRELWAMTWESIPNKAAADTSSTYPPGVTIARMTDAKFDGFVCTINPISTGGHFALQFNWSYNSTAPLLAYRIALSSVWSSWQSINLGTSNLTPGTGYTAPASEIARASYNNGVVILDGYIQPTGAAATLTAGQNIGTVPAGYRPEVAQWGVDIHVFETANTPQFETIKGAISTAGAITTRTASTYDAERIYFDAAYKSA